MKVIIIMQHQYSLALIPHEVNSSLVHQRSDNGYINATALSIAAGKRWHQYISQESTGKYIRALVSKTGISQEELIEEFDGSFWVHPKVAIHLAQWLSAEFAVQVSEWVYEYMEGRVNEPVKLPAHLNRYIINDSKIPAGYFSILQETTLGLTAPLHNYGFEIPATWAPDISVGLLFCKWLREEKGVDTDSFATYRHEWQDSRGVQKAKLYPDIHLADCRLWFRTIWLPTHGSRYFKQKDPACMQYFDQLPSIAAANDHQLPNAA